MIREEQINIATKKYVEQWYKDILNISPEDYPTDAKITIHEFTKGAEWADEHPNWHNVKDELPPPPPKARIPDFSDNVIVTDGALMCRGFYKYNYEEWDIEGDIDSDDVTHWMYIPKLPERD